MRPFALIVCVLAGGALAAHSPQPQSQREFMAAAIVDDSPGATANVSLGDIDGDGDLDVILAKGRHWASVDRVLVNDGRGKFTARDLGPARDNSYSALLSDVDGDEDLDVLVSNDSEPGRVYLNDGKGVFREGGIWGNPTWPTRFATIADLNGDGKPDVVAANRSAQEGRRSQVCMNDGRGVMDNCRELSVGPASIIATADFDRDGHLDLAVPDRDGGQSYILYNDGRGGFDRRAPFGPDTSVGSAVAVGDLDGNGWPDLVVGDENVSVFVYLNDGKGRLRSGLQLKFEGLPPPRSLTVGDLDRDGRADIVVGYYRDRGSVLYNDGTGRAFRHVRFGDALAAVYGVALGDLDGDGYLDIAAARNAAPTTVYFNRPGPGYDLVVASDRPESPVPGLQPFGPDSARLGVWRGQARYQNFHRNVEVSIDTLTGAPGTIVGSANRLTSGIPYCRTSLRLAERKTDGTYRFDEIGVAGCSGPQGSVEARWLGDGKVLWEAIFPNSVRMPGTLERAAPPIPLLPPGAAGSRTLIDTWRGQAASGPESYGVEVQIVKLSVGSASGAQVFYSPGPSESGESGWCSGPISLKEQKGPSEYVFTKTTERGRCGTEEFHARLVDSDRLLLEWFASGGGKPSATATLERKR